MKVVFLVLMLTGCVTPDQWSPEQHRKAMQTCRMMCGKNQVTSYDPWTGECLCKGK